MVYLRLVCVFKPRCVYASMKAADMRSRLVTKLREPFRNHASLISKSNGQVDSRLDVE